MLSPRTSQKKTTLVCLHKKGGEFKLQAQVVHEAKVQLSESPAAHGRGRRRAARIVRQFGNTSIIDLGFGSHVAHEDRVGDPE
jgi:hypothetical protein